MSKRLLLVDDEPNLLRAVGACLRGEGFDVVTARSGAEALVRVAETVPDLVVFLTAKDETSDRVEGFRSGVDAYLTKPFGIREAALEAGCQGYLLKPLDPGALERALRGALPGFDFSDGQAPS